MQAGVQSYNMSVSHLQQVIVALGHTLIILLIALFFEHCLARSHVATIHVFVHD